VYCIAEAQALSADGQAVAPAGIGGEPVRNVQFSDLAAVVSDSPFEQYDVTRENLMAHEQVVEAVMERSPVLPMSFGTVAGNDQQVQQLLANAVDELHQALSEVRGRVELGLKVMWRQERLFAEFANTDENIRALRDQIAAAPPEETYDQRTQLGEFIAAAMERQREVDAAQILNALQPLAVDTRVNSLMSDVMVLNASFLVERSKVSEFEARVEELRQAQDGREVLQYAGPLPPYNFVNLNLGTELQDAGMAYQDADVTYQEADMA